MQMTNGRVNIRPLNAGDEHQIIELARELQGHEVQLFDRMKPAREIGPWYLEALKKQCEETPGCIFVADVDKRIVGYATILTGLEVDDIDEVKYSYAQIGDLAVTAQARRQGIASQLISACERFSIEAGMKWLRISVLARNQPAVKLYRSQGFSDHLIELEKPLNEE